METDYGSFPRSVWAPCCPSSSPTNGLKEGEALCVLQSLAPTARAFLRQVPSRCRAAEEHQPGLPGIPTTAACALLWGALLWLPLLPLCLSPSAQA